jgi:hypothetical protein
MIYRYRYLDIVGRYVYIYIYHAYMNFNRDRERGYIAMHIPEAEWERERWVLYLFDKLILVNGKNKHD